jgi:hypothetical protein
MPRRRSGAACALHSAFNQFAAFQQDAIDNKAFVAKGQVDDADTGNWR